MTLPRTETPNGALRFISSSPELAVKAPIATSGDNAYITWWSNKTGNNEVIFRASTDGGQNTW